MPNDDIAQTDVTQETTEASSAENPTVESHESQTDQSGSSEDKKVSESVPYERFAEVNSINKTLKEEQERIKAELEAIKQAQLQPKTPSSPQDVAQQQQEQLIKEQLKKMGFLDQSEVDKRLKQIEEDQRLEANIQKLESKYSGKDGRPKFNRSEILQFAKDNQIGSLEIAYQAKHQAELINHAIQQAQGRTKPVKSETSDGSGSQNAGTTDSDLVTAARKGDKASLLSFIKRQL